MSQPQTVSQTANIKDDIPPEQPLEKKYRLFAEKENKIDLKLIMKTSLDSGVLATLSEEEKIDMIVKLKVIHLDWLNIKKIQNLDVFTHVETLYLQYNLIEKIEDLDMLINLEYLALNNNKIKHIENLKHLKKLAFLNLADNLIEDFDENELPSELTILKLNGNPCTSKSDYHKKIFTRLPDLLELDGEKVDPVRKMVALGKLPAHMLEYAKEVEQIESENQKPKGKRKEEKDKQPDSSGIFSENSSRAQLPEEAKYAANNKEEDDLNEEDEEGEDLEEDEDDLDEEEEEEEQNTESENEGIGRTTANTFRTESRNGQSDASTTYSRADESTLSNPEFMTSNVDLTLMRERTEKILKRMKEKYKQQLGDTLQEISDTRKLHEEIIKLYKSRGSTEKSDKP